MTKIREDVSVGWTDATFDMVWICLVRFIVVATAWCPESQLASAPGEPRLRVTRLKAKTRLKTNHVKLAFPPWCESWFARD